MLFGEYSELEPFDNLSFEVFMCFYSEKPAVIFCSCISLALIWCDNRNVWDKREAAVPFFIPKNRSVFAMDVGYI